MITILNGITSLQNLLYGIGSTTPIISILCILVIIITLLSVGKLREFTRKIWFFLIELTGLYILDHRSITKEFLRIIEQLGAEFYSKKLIIEIGFDNIDDEFTNTVGKFTIDGTHISWNIFGSEIIMRLSNDTFVNSAEWSEVQKLLYFYRPRQKCSSIVIFMSANTFTNLENAKIETLLSRLNSFADSEKIQAYFIIQNAQDLLQDLIGAVSESEMNIPIGWSDTDEFNRYGSGSIDHLVDKICFNIGLNLETLVSSLILKGGAKSLSFMPYNFAEAIKNPLGLALCAMMNLKHKYHFRGLYFTCKDTHRVYFSKNLWFKKIFVEDGQAEPFTYNRNWLIIRNLGILAAFIANLSLFNLYKKINDRAQEIGEELDLISSYAIDQDSADVSNKILSAIEKITEKYMFFWQIPVSWVHPIRNMLEKALINAFQVIILKNTTVKFDKCLGMISVGNLFAPQDSPNFDGNSGLSKNKAFLALFAYLEQVKRLKKAYQNLNILQTSENIDDLEEILYLLDGTKLRFRRANDLYKRALSAQLLKVSSFESCLAKIKGILDKKISDFSNSLAQGGGIVDLIQEINTNMKKMQEDPTHYCDQDFFDLRDKLSEIQTLFGKIGYLSNEDLLKNPIFLSMMSDIEEIFGSKEENMSKISQSLDSAQKSIIDYNLLLIPSFITKKDKNLILNPKTDKIITMIDNLANNFPEVLTRNRVFTILNSDKIIQTMSTNCVLWRKNILYGCVQKLTYIANLVNSNELECIQDEYRGAFIEALNYICMNIVQDSVMSAYSNLSSIQLNKDEIIANFISCIPHFISIVRFSKENNLPISPDLIKIFQTQALEIFSMIFTEPVTKKLMGIKMRNPWQKWNQIHEFIATISASKPERMQVMIKSVFENADLDTMYDNLNYLSPNETFDSELKGALGNILESALQGKYMSDLLKIYPDLVQKINILNAQAPFCTTSSNFITAAQLQDFMYFYNKNQVLFDKIIKYFGDQSWINSIKSIVNLGKWANCIFGNSTSGSISLSFKNQTLANNIQSVQLDMTGFNFQSSGQDVALDLHSGQTNLNRINFNQIQLSIPISSASSLSFKGGSTTYNLSYSGDFAFTDFILGNFSKANPDSSVELVVPLTLLSSINQSFQVNLFVNVKLDGLNWPAFEKIPLPEIS